MAPECGAGRQQRDSLVVLVPGVSRAHWLGLQSQAIESGDVLLAPSLRLPAAHGRDGGDIGSAGAFLDLDDRDDFGYCYLAQTILSTVSLGVSGGISRQSSGSREKSTE